MNSYIFSFKTFFISLILIAIYEFSLNIFFEKPSVYDSNFFEKHIIRPDSRASFVIATKMYQALNEDYQYIQIGGSGGLHGVNPALVSKDYFNASCCRIASLEGYGIIGTKIIKELNKKNGFKGRNLVYVLSPLSFPHQQSMFSNHLSKTLSENFISQKGTAINSLPSQNLRPPFKFNDLPFESIKLDKTMTLKNMESAEKIYNISLKNNGYIPFYNKINIEYPPENYFEEVLLQKENFIDWVEEISLTGKSNNYRLLVVILPLPFELEKQDIMAIKKIIFEMKKIDNVKVLDEFIEDKSFHDQMLWGDNVHMSPVGSTLFSKKLAVSMKSIK